MTRLALFDSLCSHSLVQLAAIASPALLLSNTTANAREEDDRAAMLSEAEA